MSKGNEEKNEAFSVFSALMAREGLYGKLWNLKDELDWPKWFVIEDQSQKFQKDRSPRVWKELQTTGEELRRNVMQVEV